METGRARGRRDRLLSLFLPAVLVVVAAGQVVVASNTDLTPWRGGGFGMFSTIDAHSGRFVRIEVETADARSLTFDTPSLLTDASAVEHEVLDHRAWPRDATVGALARGLRDTPVTVADGVAQVDPDGEPLPIRKVTVEVWTIEYDRASSEVTPRLVDAREVAP